jgi:hypothetical protein
MTALTDGGGMVDALAADPGFHLEQHLRCIDFMAPKAGMHADGV